MIARRPGTWGTMSGEAMDDDSRSEAIGMAGLQQQVKSLQSPGPGSSSSGWGTCAELLLVSAVKKHGPSNWDLVALELKARAVLLNVSPSCFSGEACKLQYNALKGKFGSRSGSDVSMDEDLNSMSWFDELRKLRMSHLKEELQVYDNSIYQLQSRISKLKEERGGCVSLQSVRKPQESSCGGDLESEAFKTADSRASIPAHLPCEPLEELRDSALKPAASADSPSEEFVSVGCEGRLESGLAQAGESLTKEVSAACAPSIATPDEVRGANLTTGWSGRASSLSAKVEEVQVCKDKVLKAYEVKDGENGGDSDSKEWTYLDPDRKGMLEISVNANGKNTFPGVKVANTVGDGYDELEHQENVEMQNGAKENSDTEGTIDPLPGSASVNTAVDIHEVSHRVPEAEVNNDKCYKVQSFVKESRQSRLSLSYVRAGREKRLKAAQSAQSQAIAPKARDAVNVQESHRTKEAVEMEGMEGRDINATRLLTEQRKKGMIPCCDPPRFPNLGSGSISEEIVSGSAGFGHGTDRGLEVSELADQKRSIHMDPPPGDLDVLLTGLAVDGSNPCSCGGDLQPLVAPSAVFEMKTDRVPSEHPADVASVKLDGSPVRDGREDSYMDRLQKGPITDETGLPHRKSTSSPAGLVTADLDGHRTEERQVTDDVKMEGGSSEFEQEAERKVEKLDVVDEHEGQRLDTDLRTSRSMGDTSETLGLRSSGDVKEESRDGPEIEGLHHPFPDYTDSQMDKSEVGSSMDSIEDMSPSSRKNRREPKVSGKYFPLLECLRVICAHKFAPLFRQRQDYQDNADYDRLIRRHVDLSMVRARLEEGAYSGSVEFFRDLLLIFTNALVYNSSDSQEYAGAKALRSCALIEMDKILQTEALLKQNGPATRKREVRKLTEVHKTRVSATSGSEPRRKGIPKGNNETAALDVLGGARTTHIPFEHTPLAGRSSNFDQGDRELEGRIETSLKLTTSRAVVKEETSRKETPRPELLSESKRKELRKAEPLVEEKRKEPKKPDLLPEGKRKELDKPERPSEGKRKEAHKPEPPGDSKRKELQKPELCSEGKRKESKKSEFLSEAERKESKKPELFSDAKRKEPKKPEPVSGRKSEPVSGSRGKEFQKSVLPSEGYKGAAANMSGKRMKGDVASQKSSSKGQVMGGSRASCGHTAVENAGTKLTSAKMKDVMCIDVEKNGSPTMLSSGLSPRLPMGKQKAPPILRQTSTSRVSRNCKRGGDISSSSLKKRARK